MVEREKAVAGSGCSHISFMISEITNIILISILYSIDKDGHCSSDFEKVVLAYIIIKAWTVGLRIILWGLVIALPTWGVIVTIIFYIAWIWWMVAYYIVSIIYFFDEGDAWLEDSTVMWVALLLIIIEAIGVLAILAILIMVLSCALPCIIVAVVAAKDK